MARPDSLELPKRDRGKNYFPDWSRRRRSMPKRIPPVWKFRKVPDMNRGVLELLRGVLTAAQVLKSSSGLAIP